LLDLFVVERLLKPGKGTKILSFDLIGFAEVALQF
jgi:hypothetical protein